MPEGEELSAIQIYHEQLGEIYYCSSSESGTFEVDWPEGTWDICLTYNQFSPVLHPSLVIRENVVIDSDLILSFDISEASNFIEIKPILHTGEIPQLPLEMPDGSANFGKANCDVMAGEAYIAHKGWINLFGRGLGLEQTKPETVYDSLSLFINNVSDNYYGFGYIMIESIKDEPTDLFSYSTTLDKSITISNEKNDYKLFEMDIPSTPAAAGRKKETFWGAIAAGIVVLGDGRAVDCLPSYINTYKPANKMYVYNVDLSDLESLPRFMINSIDCDDELGVLDGTQTDYIYLNGDKWEFAKSQCDTDNNDSLLRLPGGIRNNQYPSIGEYFFSSDEQIPNVVNNAPFLSLACQVFDRDGKKIPAPLVNYYGQFGELRFSDMQLAQTKLTIDGKDVEDVFPLFSLRRGALTPYFAAEEPCKEVKITAVNENIEIDGVAGSNVAEIKILNGEDKCPPSVQMLAFRDKKSGLRTHNFKAENGQLQFSAADLNWTTQEIDGRNKFWFALETPEVKAEYAPHGTETFVPLEVTEHPDRFYTPCFGAYYTAELNEVATTGWQDLRLTITDAAGNSQTQTLSPAFNIQAPDGIESVTNDGNAVIWHDGVLYSGSDATFDVFDLSGRKVAAGHGPEAELNLPAGVYIVDSRATIIKIAVN